MGHGTVAVKGQGLRILEAEDCLFSLEPISAQDTTADPELTVKGGGGDLLTKLHFCEIKSVCLFAQNQMQLTLIPPALL